MGIIDYNRTGELIEIVVRESSGRKLETHVCNVRDRKKYTKILEYLKEKYGFEPLIDVKDSINGT
jgi:hypothetical protein